MTKREYIRHAQENNKGRDLMDLFFEPVHPKTHGYDMIAIRESSNFSRPSGMPRSLSMKLDLLEHRFAGEPLPLP